MKKTLITFAAILICAFGNALAQAPKAYKLALAESVNSPEYTLPVTAVKIKVVVEKETVRTGPYARFAQKFMGAIAPLSDKELYKIKSAEITYADPDTETVDNKITGVEAACCPLMKSMSHISNDSIFTKSSPDRMSITDRSLEDMARDAATTIYTLRKRRFDLVTGEAGENVYGAGLKAAIDEMARMENEYLSLFFGKQTTTTIVKEYDVIPQAGKTSYVAFRFSPEWGAMPESDMSGQPVMLTLKPERVTDNVSLVKQDKRSVTYYRVAGWTECVLSDEVGELASARIPIYQFGVTVGVAGK